MYLEIFTIYLIIELFAYIILHSAKFKNRYEYIKRYLSFNSNNRYVVDNYSFFWNNKNYIFNNIMVFNEHGYRSEKILKKKKKILILGDSTSESIPYIKNNKDIWAMKLQELLKKRKKNYQILNASLNCGTSNELLSHLFFKARYFKPEIIIFFAGINDLYPILDRKFEPDYSHSKYYNKFYIRNYEKYFIKFSFLAKLIFLFLTKKKSFSFFNIYNFNENNININTSEKKIKKNKFYILKNNLRLLKIFCEKNNINLVLVPPCVNKTNSKKLRLNRLFVLSDKYITQIFEKYKSHKCYYLNINKIKTNSNFYLDFLHFNKNGHEKFSKEIYRLLYKIIS